jgi:hypothetical protein
MKKNLPVYYWKHLSSGVFGKIEIATVLDLSIDGCRIHVCNDHDLYCDDSITLIFRLDNSDRTEIQKEAVVRWVEGNFIGCKYSIEHDLDILFYVNEHTLPN